jgi:hypothetical protein
MKENPSTIDNTRVFDGILFASHHDRCRYIGTETKFRAGWLEQNPGRWRRLQDPPSCQPASPPAPMNQNISSESTQTELLPPVKAAKEKTNGPGIETTPLGETGRKKDRGGDRQIKKQKLPPEVSRDHKKRSPKLMRVVLEHLREYPVLTVAASKSGIHIKTFEYWIKRSKAGDDEYEIEWQGQMWRFHEHCESAIQEAHDTLFGAMFDIAMGGPVYKKDERLLSLGYEGHDAYAKDENGNFIVESVRPPNPKVQLLLLQWRRPETWGKNKKSRKSNVAQQGGVIVVGDVPAKPKKGSAASINARKWKAYSKIVREAKD